MKFFRLGFFPAVFPLLFSLPAHSFCDHILTGVQNLQVSRQLNPETNSCFVSLMPRKIINMKYRDYLISNAGLFMVFNSYGAGSNSTSTAAREFFFFPRTATEVEVRLPETDDEDVQVMVSSGRWLTFSRVNADLSAIETGSVRRDPRVRKTNKGGIEIPTYQGLMLDAGFTIGQSPTDDLSRESVFRDEFGMTCSVINEQIFFKDGYNSILKSDSEIAAFLKTQCPQLKVDFE